MLLIQYLNFELTDKYASAFSMVCFTLLIEQSRMYSVRYDTQKCFHILYLHNATLSKER